MSIKEVFAKNGFVISTQALNILESMKDCDVHASKILEQAKLRKLAICGGDIIKYQITGKISSTIGNSEDL